MGKSKNTGSQVGGRMRSSYTKEDVTILLKEITGKMIPMNAAEREKQIQKGIHYSEMLPVEYSPSAQYKKLYEEALVVHAEKTACAVACLAQKIAKKKGSHVVLVSLARAGTPIGILLKRYFKKKYGWDVPHYTISIIRGRGIDRNAMNTILSNHKAETIQFVDGWIGKGAITLELKKEMENYPGVSGELAVLADPACMTGLYGTSEDFLIPSACLNATVSGLFSRTVLNDTLIGPEDYHGAVYYPNLEQEDVSEDFLFAVEAKFPFGNLLKEEEEKPKKSGLEEVNQIQKQFGITDRNLIKPGIGETTRVLMRRMPWKILVRDKTEHQYIGHILRLAQEKGIEVEEYPLQVYRACGMIQDLHADL